LAVQYVIGKRLGKYFVARKSDKRLRALENKTFDSVPDALEYVRRRTTPLS
jgi:hypothetical protein